MVVHADSAIPLGLHPPRIEVPNLVCPVAAILSVDIHVLVPIISKGVAETPSIDCRNDATQFIVVPPLARKTLTPEHGDITLASVVAHTIAIVIRSQLESDRGLLPV
jgi:hypothetical protein